MSQRDRESRVLSEVKTFVKIALRADNEIQVRTAIAGIEKVICEARTAGVRKDG